MHEVFWFVCFARSSEGLAAGLDLDLHFPVSGTAQQKGDENRGRLLRVVRVVRVMRQPQQEPWKI